MDKLILGLLMIKRLTVYEIKSIIQKNFRDKCSGSMGAIQSAIKKLLAADMIIFSEYVEKSVNKKQYSITEKGREEFFKWLHVPANISGSKNMELGKLLFLGMLPMEKRVHLIEEIISKLDMYLLSLLEIQSSINDEDKQQIIKHWESDIKYFSCVIENTEDVIYFQEITLQYSIDITKFNIEWFKKLKEMQEKNVSERGIE